MAAHNIDQTGTWCFFGLTGPRMFLRNRKHRHARWITTAASILRRTSCMRSRSRRARSRALMSASGRGDSGSTTGGGVAGFLMTGGGGGGGVTGFTTTGGGGVFGFTTTGGGGGGSWIIVQ